MRMGRRVWVIIAVMAAVVTILVGSRLTGGAEVGSQATTLVERGDFAVSTTTTGELAAVKSTPISSPPGWNNKVSFLVDEGTLVAPGDEVARFDTDQLEQQREERLASYEGALADLESQRVNNQKTLASKHAMVARRELSLEKTRLQAEAMQFESESRQRQMALDLKQAELDLQEAKDDLAVQEEMAAVDISEKEVKVRKARLDLERTEDNLAKMVITAQDSGMLVYKKIWTNSGQRKIRVGDQVWSGNTILELPDLSEFKVNSWVNEGDIHRLELEQPARVTIDALQNRELRGKVIRISPLARQEGEEEGKKLKVFDVELLLDGDVEGALPGMTAQCRIIHEEFLDVLHVPLEAVFQEEDGPVVYTTDGQAHSVELGAVGEDRVVIVSGVDEGEELLLVRPGDTKDEGS